MSDFLQLAGRTVLVTGIANRRSVAWHIARTLEEQGARVVYSVRSAARRQSLAALLGDRMAFVCDVEEEGAAARLAAELQAAGLGPLHGVVHSIAFANYREGMKPFHEASRADFLQATTISAFSLVELSRALKPLLAVDASVVTIGISSLQVTPDNYGYMGPIKAALESCARFLAKSFSAEPAPRRGFPATSRVTSTRRNSPSASGASPRRRWPMSPPSCSAPAAAGSTARPWSSMPASPATPSTGRLSA